MAEVCTIGKVYTAPYIKARTIAFVDSDPDTITDSADGFVTALFNASSDIVVATDSTTNDGTYAIDTGGVAAGTLTLEIGETLSAESAGQDVTIIQKAPGILRAGFVDVTINQDNDIIETTSFDDLISASIIADTIAFVDGGGSDDSITDSGDGLVAAGFVANKEIMIRGSTLNNYSCTPSAVAVGALTVPTGTVTAEIAGDTVTILQFNLWKTFAVELKQWTATANGLWVVTNDNQDLFGIPHYFRFFRKYYATPSGVDIAVYYEGIGIVNAISTPLVAGRLIKEPITITGVGALTLTTKDDAW